MFFVTFICTKIEGYSLYNVINTFPQKRIKYKKEKGKQKMNFWCIRFEIYVHFLTDSYKIAAC